jgi:predicted porin
MLQLHNTSFAYVVKSLILACAHNPFFGIINVDFSLKHRDSSKSPVGNARGLEPLLFKFVELEICMNRKLMALAVAAAVSCPGLALADDSTATLYGTLNVDLENVKGEGCSAVNCVDIKSRTRVSSNSSNIGFRGLEPLGEGLNAWFQVESSVPVDVGGGAWSSRNSGVGLNGTFGSILLGQWDSPYKVSTVRMDPFGDTTIAGYTGILGGNFSQTLGNTGLSFDRRMRNTVQYWTPNFAGLSGRVAYGANEEKPANGSSNPTSLAASASYENGPLYLTGAYETHKDFGSLNPAAPQGKDTGYKFGASYTIANAFTLSAIYEWLKYQTDVVPAGPNERKYQDWWVSGTYKLAANAFSLSYGQKAKNEDNGVDKDNTGAQYYAARYGYSLSKRTEFYALYVKIKNDSAVNRDFMVGVNPLGVDGQGNGALPLGADPTGFGVGLIHKF